MKIALLTTSRADWGLLERLATLISEDRDCELLLIVGGVHLSMEHGLTINQINLPHSARVECLLSDDSKEAMAKSIGLGCISGTDVLRNLKPDWLVVLGDRFEVFSVVVSAYSLGIPVAHISGGEVTSGSLDDGWRHCITKLSSLHFVYAEDYRKRVIQLGEHPDTVFNVGHIALEGIERFKHEAENPYYVVMWHPETIRSAEEQAIDLGVLFAFLGTLDEQLVFFTSQGDPNSRQINKEIKRFCQKPGRTWTENLDREEFLTLLGGAKALIGNSSAGIYEAPVMGVPTINIGRRQNGRLKATSVIDCNMKFDELRNSIKAIECPQEQHHIPYAGKLVSEKILMQLKSAQKSVGGKGFYDIA